MAGRWGQTVGLGLPISLWDPKTRQWLSHRHHSQQPHYRIATEWGTPPHPGNRTNSVCSRFSFRSMAFGKLSLPALRPFPFFTTPDSIFWKQFFLRNAWGWLGHVAKFLVLGSKTVIELEEKHQHDRNIVQPGQNSHARCGQENITKEPCR